MTSAARPVSIVFGLVLSFALTTQASGPAEPLFLLVPPDAAATLAIEDLRSHTADFFAASFAEEFQQLPAYRTWLASAQFLRFDQASKRIEDVVGEKMSQIRDDLLGDAVVLTMHCPPQGRPEDARGLLLVRVRNRALLERLIRGVNSAQAHSGDLARLSRTNREGVNYWTREFRPAIQKPNDYFTILDDNTFAWSNDQSLIHGVIDRRARRTLSLGDEPSFQRVRKRLPEQAAVSLFVAPNFLQSFLTASTRSKNASGNRAVAMLARYLGSLKFFGASLQWSDGLFLHTEEIIEPARLDPWLRHWVAKRGETVPDGWRVPASALAMASGPFDFNALLDAVRGLLSLEEQSRLDNLILTLDGILLGHGLREEILPRMGPGVLAYLEPPSPEDESSDSRLAKVSMISLGDAPGLTAALENALRTSLAFYALNLRHGDGQLHVESHDVEGRNVTSLRPTSPFAYAIDRDHLILGSSPAAVARSFPRAADSKSELERIREERFPEDDAYACVDFLKLNQYLIVQRESLAERLATRQHRPVSDSERELDQAIALMALFQKGYMTSAIEPDATAIHRSVGLIVRKLNPSTPR